MQTDQGARDGKEQVEDGEVVLDPENTSSVLGTIFITVNNEFQQDRRDVAVRLLNVHPIRQSPDGRVSGPSIQFQAYLELRFWRTRFGPSCSS
jgi:hypothetical protein